MKNSSSGDPGGGQAGGTAGGIAGSSSTETGANRIRPQQQLPRRFETHHELFAETHRTVRDGGENPMPLIPGARAWNRPLGALMPRRRDGDRSPSPTETGGGVLRPFQRRRGLSRLLDPINILPEDPVESLFEQERILEEKRQKAESEVRKNKKLLLQRAVKTEMDIRRQSSVTADPSEIDELGEQHRTSSFGAPSSELTRSRGAKGDRHSLSGQSSTTMCGTLSRSSRGRKGARNQSNSRESKRQAGRDAVRGYKRTNTNQGANEKGVPGRMTTTSSASTGNQGAFAFGGTSSASAGDIFGGLWGSVLDQATQTLAEQPLSVEHRNSCLLVREFIFGENNGMTNCAAVPTKEEVVTLYKVWLKLDDNDSGRVDVGEFRAYCAKLENPKFGEKLLQTFLGKKSSFGIEDVFRVVWPYATPEQGQVMKGWIQEWVTLAKRVKTPPILPTVALEALYESFRFMDTSGDGNVTVEEMVSSGLVEPEQAERYMKEFDTSGDGEMDMREFCEMLCPAGFRAFPDSKSAVDTDDNVVIYEDNYGWRIRPPPGAVGDQRGGGGMLD